MKHPAEAPGERLPPTPRQAVLARQRRLLLDLLRKVWQRSAFYREYYASHGIRERDLPDVTVRDLPFASKDLHMAHLDRVATDSRLRKATLERWLDEVRDPRQTFEGDFIVMHSSGSSGKTGIFVYSRTDWRVMNGIMAGRLPRPENYPAGRTRVAFYRAAHGHFAGVATAVHLPDAVYDTLIVSLLDPVDRVIEQLHRFQPHRLTGYASSIAQLAARARDGQLRIQPRQIFVSGDLLTAGMEAAIREAWAAPICNLYGASESLFLAIGDRDQGGMEVMDDLNVLEVLDETGSPVASGGEGRVVVTNLYNHTLPVLRYELGDFVVAGVPSETSGFSTIEAIRAGKANDALPIVLDSGAGDTISPRALTSFYAPGLEKAQFIARPRLVRIDYVAREGIDDEVRAEFRRMLRLRGASRTAVEVRRVSSIAPDAATGKVRLVRREDFAAGPPPLVPRAVAPADAGGARPRVASAFVAFPEADTERSVPQRFARQVERHADRMAVQDGACALTYAALDRAANRVAHAVLARGGTGQEPVALMVEPGVPAVVSMLGVLKAGRFYLPLDPSYPPAWLGRVLAEAQPSLIVTSEATRAVTAALVPDPARVLDLDDLDPGLPEDDPALRIPPDALAYLVYTSGSTGRPKGVVHSHRNLLHQIMTYTNGLQLGPDDRVALLHSHAVSAARLDVFGALLNGAVLLPFSPGRDGVRALSRWLAEAQVTLLHWIPTGYRHLVDVLTGVESFPGLRWLVLGSEPVLRRDVESSRRHFAAAVLVNRFGTTETGNIAWFFVDQNTEIRGQAVPVGDPVPDVEVRVLDEAGADLAPGEIGEIAVRSRYLSPGYWRRPELTAEAYARDPLASDTTTYRTGDVGYRQPDGRLVHLGRKDSQAKIRGHRVELDDVRGALLDHPAVREAVVVARASASGETRLVAFVVFGESAPPAGGALRRFVEARLPAHMVPAAFVPMDRLPLAPGGKVALDALAEPDGAEGEADDPLAEPGTPLEQALGMLWAAVLGVPRVGAHDSFLDLGGHSLHAGLIVSRVMDAFGVQVSLRDLFDSPTVASMARIVEEERRRAGAEPGSPAGDPGPPSGR